MLRAERVNSLIYGPLLVNGEGSCTLVEIGDAADGQIKNRISDSALVLHGVGITGVGAGSIVDEA